MSKRVSFSEAKQDFANVQDSDSETEDSRISEEPQSRQFNKFELLGLVEGADDQLVAESSASDQPSEDNDEQSDCIKTKHLVANQLNANTGSKRKARKKRGKKGSKSKNKELEDIENELNTLTQAIVLHASANQKRDENVRFKMLKVDMRNLIPETEIKRMFGKSVVREDKSNRVRQHPGSNLQRSRFVSSGYYEAKSSGGPSGPKMDLDEEMNNSRKLDLEHTTGHAARKYNSGQGESSSAIFYSDEPIYFKFIHDKAYQEAHKEFLLAVNQGHPERIVQNLMIAPFHAESLVQLSHMVRVSEDYKSASEFIERALIVFEKGFHPRFNLATANCRLTYKRPENRTFFITIFKHITYCHRRGLRQTPFEYSKLLLSLEPENDPLQAIQMIDFFALRSEEYNYVIDFYQKWDRSQKLPNISYSVALAHFMKSRCTKQTKEENSKHLAWADEFLQRALLIFPNFIIPLLDACSGEPSDELKKCSYFDYSVYGTNYKLVPETVDTLISLYVKRNYSLWKRKPVMAWLERNVESMVEKFASSELTDERRQVEHWHAFPKIVPKNLLRHIVLCDLGMKIPSSASSSTFLDSDPYPPSDSIVSYNATYESSSQSAQTDGGSLIGNIGGMFLRSFLPSFSVNENQPQPPQPPVAPSGDQAPQLQQTSRRQQGRGQARQTPSGQGLQITMADYVIDDEDDLAAAAAGVHGGGGPGYTEMHGTIRDLAAAVTNLLNMQPTIRAHQERAPDGSDPSNSQPDGDQGSPNQGAADQRRNP